jgi:GNAT superfamily N-acetyltransferase
MNDEKIAIRFARPDETPLILGFIRELAAYEHMLGQVSATEAVLQKTIFEEKRAEVLFCEYDTEIAGFALFFHNFSTFLGKSGLYLEDLYVRPDMRGRGLGKALFAALARLAIERSCDRLEWACLDWNTPSIGFYLGLGARQMTEWTTYRLTGEKLDELAGEKT